LEKFAFFARKLAIFASPANSPWGDRGGRRKGVKMPTVITNLFTIFLTDWDHTVVGRKLHAALGKFAEQAMRTRLDDSELEAKVL